MSGTKLWLWKNGDHYLAYDNPMPCYPDGGDPLVLGKPAAIAFLMPSTPGWSEDEKPSTGEIA
jgi:hypothetical protein